MKALLSIHITPPTCIRPVRCWRVADSAYITTDSTPLAASAGVSIHIGLLVALCNRSIVSVQKLSTIERIGPIFRTGYAWFLNCASSITSAEKDSI